jgi:hypothetical protein
MRPVETIPEIGMGEGIKEDGGRDSTMTDCKNFGKHHDVPPVQQIYDNKKVEKK